MTQFKKKRTQVRSPATTGAMNEMVVCVELLRLGWQVFRNVSPNGIDLIIYRDGRTLRVEVTTGQVYPKTGTVNWPTKDHRMADILAVVVPGESKPRFYVSGPTLVMVQEPS